MEKRRRHIALVLIGGALATAGCEQLLDIPDVTLGSSSGGGDGGGDAIGNGEGGIDGALADGSSHQLPALSPLGCTPDGWCWITPSPQGNNLAGSWTGSDSEIWAVGQSGTIEFFDGEKIQTGFITTQDLNAIWGDGSGNVWAMGTGGILFTHAAGAPIDQWAPVPTGLALPAATVITGLWGDGKGNLWAVGQSGAFFAFNLPAGAWSSAVTDGGNLSAINFSAIGQDSHGVGIATGTNGAAFSFDGSAWSALSLPGVTATTNLRAIVHDGSSTWIFGSGPGFSELAIEQDTSGTWADDSALLFVDSGVGGGDNQFGRAAFLGPDGSLHVFGHYHWIRTPGGQWSFGPLAEPSASNPSVASSINAIGGITQPVAFGGGGIVTKLESDAGATYVSNNVIVPTTSVNVLFPAGNAVWIGANEGLLRVEDGGISLVSLVDGGSPISGWGASENDVWISTNVDAGYHWDGAKISLVKDPPAGAAVNGTSATNVFAFEPSGKTRVYNGVSWADDGMWSTTPYEEVSASFIDPISHEAWVAADDPDCDSACAFDIAHGNSSGIFTPNIIDGSYSPVAIGGLAANDIWMLGTQPFHWNGLTLGTAVVPSNAIFSIGLGNNQLWFGGLDAQLTVSYGMWKESASAGFVKLPGIGVPIGKMASTPTQIVACAGGFGAVGSCLWHPH